MDAVNKKEEPSCESSSDTGKSLLNNGFSDLKSFLSHRMKNESSANKNDSGSKKANCNGHKSNRLKPAIAILSIFCGV